MPRISPSDQESRPDTYFMADLRVDVGRQCVSRGDGEVALPNLSFRLLVALIHGAPNVVSNDRLMDLVWPGQIVSPETLNKRVKMLRDALGDDVRDPRYVASVRSRGYRLIATVETATPASATDSTQLSDSGHPGADIPLQPVVATKFSYGRRLAWSA